MSTLELASFWTWGGWSFFVAVGTIGLAAGTFRLARYTRDAVKESQRQIDLSAREVAAVEKQGQVLAEQTDAVRDQVVATEREVAVSTAALEASARPVLVGAVPPPVYRTRRERVDAELETVQYSKDYRASVERDRVHYEETDDMVYCSVPLRNVGAGVAFVQRITLLARTTYDGRISNPVVPNGEVVRVRFAVARRQSDGAATDINAITRSGRGFAQFKIYVVYTGASHELVTASEVTVAEVPDGNFVFTGNEIWDGDTGDRVRLASTENVG
jgi:hypothetical protein